jgi:alanine racemase
MVHSPNIVRIDLSSVAFNLKLVKSLISSDTKIMGVVKSDAYGHGIIEVSRTLEKNGVYALGTAFIHEAVMLREKGIRTPIVILCGIKTREEAEAAVVNDIIPVVFDLPSSVMLSEAAEIRSKKADILIKIDTGMGRLGVDCNDTASFLKKIASIPRLNVRGLMSHLSSADEDDRTFTNSQIENFKRAIDAARAMGMDLHLNTLANSAGIMGYKESHFDMVRPGIMLYGGLPTPGFEVPVELRPVMDFRGRVVQVRELPGNTPVSYGRRYYTKGVKRIAAVSAGYGDGIPRGLTNKGRVIVRGERADIVGTVCMNLLMVDVTNIEATAPGDEVVFLGAQGKVKITGDEIAELNNTISYEIFLSLGRGADREYIRG